MREVLTLVLGGGRGVGLYPLTKHRSEPAVPIAGKYRLIDIPISNCLNSGLNRIYVLTQFLSVSLHRHIANTYKFGAFSRGFVEVLPAQQTHEAAYWYEGTADAVRQNIRYVQEDGCAEILVLSSDQLYRLDFGQMLQAHRRCRADLTIAVVPVPQSQTPGLGLVGLGEGDRIVQFIEKPQTEDALVPLRLPAGWLEARGIAPRGREYLANMGIYLFNRETLLELLNSPPSAKDFARDIFPHCLTTHRVQGHLCDGYWQDLGTVKSYHAANLALAGPQPPFDFHTPEGVIYTRMRNLPASRVSGAHLQHCLVSDGCVIQPGASLQRCLVGVRSRIGRDATLRDTIIIGADRFETDAERADNRQRGIPDFTVGEGAVIERAILDKDCRIGRKVRIINRRNLQEDEGINYVIRDGIVVIPNQAVVPDGTVI
jgi:glucose-1-phosphate adenylyltransferase